jgi:putative transposase
MTTSQTTYPTDLKDSEWRVIEQYLPRRVPKGPGGRPREHSWRTILNATFYITRGGQPWSLMPKDFPPAKTVYHYFRLWRKDGTWQMLNDALRQTARQRAGRAAQPSAAILDSQSAKSAEGGQARGFDGGKKITGRKRHLVVDTLGWVLIALVTAANVQDVHAGRQVLQKLHDWLHQSNGAPGCRLERIWADGGYRGELIAWARQAWGWTLEIVTKLADQVGFQVLPKRWIVERTFAWLTRNRRLARDYERLPETSEAFIYVAMIRLMLKRIAHAT